MNLIETYRSGHLLSELSCNCCHCFCCCCCCCCWHCVTALVEFLVIVVPSPAHFATAVAFFFVDVTVVSSGDDQYCCYFSNVVVVVVVAAVVRNFLLRSTLSSLLRLHMLLMIRACETSLSVSLLFLAAVVTIFPPAVSLACTAAAAGVAAVYLLIFVSL